ncbi:AAA family ATPase [Naumannella cuiyingiana]|uniref:Uncharacterized protein n=1 Tax=Naumannella cuiyingiana TaxID=1347891 RepID=A0A7Z0DB16_9ACTN|nr:hypothetical protein [Naumannella cuiyingiana]
MIVWVNGAFGAGKTQTAHELRRRLGRGWVADPELPGFGLQRMLPGPLRSDFQEFAAWRSGVAEMLARADGGREQPVIAPMTLVDDAYFAEIVGGLRAAGHDVRHVALQASPQTLRRRLAVRQWKRRDLWALEQIDRCVAALRRPEYAEAVPTDGRSIDQVVEAVAAALGLELARPALGPLAARAYRLRVQLAHIRVGALL